MLCARHYCKRQWITKQTFPRASTLGFTFCQSKCVPHLAHIWVCAQRGVTAPEVYHKIFSWSQKFTCKQDISQVSSYLLFISLISPPTPHVLPISQSPDLRNICLLTWICSKTPPTPAILSFRSVQRLLSHCLPAWLEPYSVLFAYGSSCSAVGPNYLFFTGRRGLIKITEHT